MKKHNSGAEFGAMLTKTETSSGAEFISFLQELRSPVLNEWQNLNFIYSGKCPKGKNHLHNQISF